MQERIHFAGRDPSAQPSPLERLRAAQRTHDRWRRGPHADAWTRPGTLRRIALALLGARWARRRHRFELACPLCAARAHIYPGPDPEIRCQACDLHRPVFAEIYRRLGGDLDAALAMLEGKKARAA